MNSPARDRGTARKPACRSDVSPHQLTEKEPRPPADPSRVTNLPVRPGSPPAAMSIAVAQRLQAAAGNRAVTAMVAQRRTAATRPRPSTGGPSGRADAAPAARTAAAGGALAQTSAAAPVTSPSGTAHDALPPVDAAAIAGVPVQRAQARSGGPTSAASPAARAGPYSDPKFAALRADIRGKQQAMSAHPSPVSEASRAQGAAKPPQDDREAQGKAANAERMNAAKPGEFDKAAFVRAVNEAIAAQAPKNLDEADKFADSGKADAVKGQVQGQVGKGKEASARQIEATTKAPPDTSKAKDKAVIPLVPDRPPGVPGTPDPTKAVPDKAPSSATDFSAGPAQVDHQMTDAQVTEEQLAKSNEPEFTDALKEKRAGEAHAATAPGQVRAAEAQTLAGAKAAAGAAGGAAMTALASDRKTAGAAVGSGKEAARSADERKRAQVTAKLQKVYDATKKEVEGILSGLDKKVDDQFTAGEKAARDAFTADYENRIERYKKKRYSGINFWKWGKDKLLGLPGEVTVFYDQARKGYVDRMQQVISSVADTIAGELRQAKQRIAQGRNELQAKVKGLPPDLQAIGKEAAGDFAGRFDELTEAVDAKGKELVDTLATKYTEALKAVDAEIAAEKEKNQGLVAKAMNAVGGVIKTILELKEMLLGVLAKAASALAAIIKDPIGFLGNLVSAVGAGLRAFMANIGEHLRKGLVGWLLGAMASAGLDLPAKFDLRGIITMIASLLGLTWNALRARIVQRGVPEPAMNAVEQSVPLAQKLQSEGVGGVTDEIKTQVGDLRQNLFSKITEYLIPTVLIAGITWIVSLLNPASAFIKACKMIIDFVTFVVNQGAQIIEFVSGVLDAIIAIAGGGTGGVPQLIEKALARSVPVLIGALAAILGIGSLANKVKSFFHTLTRPVRRAIDGMVDRIVTLGKKAWARIKAKFKGGGNRKGDAASPERKLRAKKAAANEAQQRLARGVEVGTMKSVLQQVYTKYKGDGVSLIRMAASGPYSFRVVAHGSDGKESDNQVHVPSKKESDDPNDLRLTPETVKTFTTKVTTGYSKALNEAREELLRRGEKWTEEKSYQLPTEARGVLKWKMGARVRRHQSSEPATQKTHVHHVDGAHAEEQVTNLFQRGDVPELQKNKEMVSDISARWEVNRSPCVNCAHYIAEFVDKDLRSVSGDVHAEVRASALYQGATDFSGEIRQEYPAIFDRFAEAGRLFTEQQIEKVIQKQKLADPKAAAWDPVQKRFSGHPLSATKAEAERRANEYESLPDDVVDVRRDWFRLGGGYASGRAGIAILLNRGISFTKLGPDDLDLPPLGQDPDKDLKLYTLTELIEKEKRERFLAALDQSTKKMLRQYHNELALHTKEEEKAQAGSAAKEIESEGKAGNPGAAT